MTALRAVCNRCRKPFCRSLARAYRSPLACRVHVAVAVQSAKMITPGRRFYCTSFAERPPVRGGDWHEWDKPEKFINKCGTMRRDMVFGTLLFPMTVASMCFPNTVPLIRHVSDGRSEKP